MDRAGDDIAQQAPTHRIGLSYVGVTRTDIPVQIVDPFDPDRTISMACTVEAGVSLAADRRGIHVSRIGDLLAVLASQAFPSLREYAAEACGRLRANQGADEAGISVRGVLTYLERVPSTSGKLSLEHVAIGAACRQTGDAAEREDLIAFNHLTACPCVQQTLKHSLTDGTGDLFGLLTEQGVPALTHTQRSRSEVRVRSHVGAPPLRHWLASLDAVVVRCLNTMPRDVELHAVYRAHANPQFLEDVIRDELHATAALMRPRDPSAWIAVRGTSMESIHDFDITAEAAATAGELDRR